MNAIIKTFAALLLASGLTGVVLAAPASNFPVVGLNAFLKGGAFGQQSDAGTGAYVQTFDNAPSNAIYDQIIWWGFYGVGSTADDNFVVKVNGVQQQGSLETYSLQSDWKFDGYRYTLTLDSPGAAVPTTDSEISIFNDADVEWYWQSAAVYNTQGLPYGNDTNNVAYALIGSLLPTPGAELPEPGSLSLAMLALVALRGLGARRRASAAA